MRDLANEFGILASKREPIMVVLHKGIKYMKELIDLLDKRTLSLNVDSIIFPL